MSATRKGLSSSAAKRLGFGAAKATAPAPIVFTKLRRVICDRHTTFQGRRQLHGDRHWDDGSTQPFPGGQDRDALPILLESIALVQRQHEQFAFPSTGAGQP